MMMIYGMFVFELRTAPYQTFNHTLDFRHVKNDRVGKSAKWQYAGPGEDKITLAGTLYPEVTGGDVSLELLKTSAYMARPMPLIEGTGMIYGMYVITNLVTERTEFFTDGKAKKIDFNLSLSRVSEDIREGLANITMSDLMGTF
ncbi:MAG: phage tail protein [Providencia heimbachae]|nr:phage tail protein [Providencia heimbachae]